MPTTVFKVSKQGFKSTRLFLACTAWGEEVRAGLVRLGFTVVPIDEPHWPDLRDAAELKRRDALLAKTGI